MLKFFLKDFFFITKNIKFHDIYKITRQFLFSMKCSPEQFLYNCQGYEDVSPKVTREMAAKR